MMTGLTANLDIDQAGAGVNQTFDAGVHDDNQSRADTYRLLGALLGAPPAETVLNFIKALPEAIHEDGVVAKGWRQLRAEAQSIEQTSDLEKLNDEYHDLFIGVGRGELVPYGSWYLSGFLMDTPLSDLRDDLQKLGIERDPTSTDPEDHIGALFETMAIIIEADDIGDVEESGFFRRHIQPWAGKFFTDLGQAKKANFYKAVAQLGECFVDFEQQYLSMQV